MSAEVDAICGAPYGARSPERANSRNGYRTRDLDTRAGTVPVTIPKLREGSYLPDWLLERRKRAERALTSVVATCSLLGVSTRRMEKLVKTLGITRLSKSQVSVMARELDEQVADFRSRPVNQGPYTFVAADPLTMKVREGGRVVLEHVLTACGVNADGHREILGVDVTSAEDGAGWLAFFRDLTVRGLSGVSLVTSDAHTSLVAALGATLPGAAWQRCRTHYAANLMSVTPKTSWPWVKALLHSVYDQPDAASVPIGGELAECFDAFMERSRTRRQAALGSSVSVTVSVAGSDVATTPDDGTPRRKKFIYGAFGRGHFDNTMSHHGERDEWSQDPHLALSDPDDLAGLEETLDVLSDPEALADIPEADAAYARGDVMRGAAAVRGLRPRDEAA